VVEVAFKKSMATKVLANSPSCGILLFSSNGPGGHFRFWSPSSDIGLRPRRTAFGPEAVNPYGADQNARVERTEPFSQTLRLISVRRQREYNSEPVGVGFKSATGKCKQ